MFLFSSLAVCSPRRDEGGKDSVRLRRPVWDLTIGTERGETGAQQIFDFKNEAHSSASSSRPSPEIASSCLLRTISTSFSCGVRRTAFDGRSNPAVLAAANAS